MKGDLESFKNTRSWWSVFSSYWRTVC